MSIYALKPRFQGLLRPLTRGLFALGVTANQVTMFACLVSLALGIALAADPAAYSFLLLPTWLIVRMALNAIDGMLAREFGQKSALGTYLNELTDVIADAALYAPFALLPGSNPWLVAAVIALAIVAELAGTVAVMTGASRRYDGPMGKSDRAFLFGVVALLVGSGVPTAAWLNWVWAGTALLLAATIHNRVRKGLAELPCK